MDAGSADRGGDGRFVGIIFNVASLTKSERLISSSGHGCLTSVRHSYSLQLPDFPHMVVVDPG